MVNEPTVGTFAPTQYQTTQTTLECGLLFTEPPLAEKNIISAWQSDIWRVVNGWMQLQNLKR